MNPKKQLWIYILSKATTLDIHKIHYIQSVRHFEPELWIPMETMDTMDLHETQKRNPELWILFYAFYGYPNGYPKRGMNIHLDFMDIQMDIQKEYFGCPKRVMDIQKE